MTNQSSSESGERWIRRHILRDSFTEEQIIQACWHDYNAFFVVLAIDDNVVTCAEAPQYFDEQYQVTLTASSLNFVSHWVREDLPFDESVCHFKFDSENILCSGDKRLLDIAKSICNDEQRQQQQSQMKQSDNTTVSNDSSEKICCKLCHVDNRCASQTGPLSFVEGHWIHSRCCYFSSRKAHERLETVLSRARKSKCRYCGLYGATFGCMNLRCKAQYHYLCAPLAGAEWFDGEECDDREFSFKSRGLYCCTHLAALKQKMLALTGFPAPADTYLWQNDWSAIDESDIRLMRRERNNLWEEYRPYWFREKLAALVRVVEITAQSTQAEQGWAYCPDMAKQNKRQFGVIAACYIGKGVVIGEYTGELQYYEHDGEKSDYVAEFFSQQSNKAIMLRDLFIDGARYGNEMRYINSVWPGKTPPDVEANVHMQSVWCRNHPRILVVTACEIAAKAAIVMDYGCNYFFKR